MRLSLALLLMGGLAALADDAPGLPKEPEPRYGVTAKVSTYPQTSAKRALESTIEACEKDDYKYLVAHLLDPAFVDARAADRGKQFEPAVEVELTKLRDFQYANPDRVDAFDRLPRDRNQFLAVVIAKSKERGFQQLTRDVEVKLREEPQTIKDLKLILRGGAFTDAAGGAVATHPQVKEKSLYFRKIGDRWFLENRQTEEPKKEQ